MFKNQYKEPNKMKFVGWVGRNLEKSLSKQTLKANSKQHKSCHLVPKAMDDKTKPSNVYKTTPHTLDDKDNNSKASEDNQQWGAHEATK